MLLADTVSGLLHVVYYPGCTISEYDHMTTVRQISGWVGRSFNDSYPLRSGFDAAAASVNVSSGKRGPRWLFGDNSKIRSIFMLIVQRPKNLLKQLLRSINIWILRVNSTPFALSPWQYTFCWYTPDTVPRKTSYSMCVYCGENTKSKKWISPDGYRGKSDKKTAFNYIYSTSSSNQSFPAGLRIWLYTYISAGCFLDNQLRLWCLYIGRKPGCSISDQAPEISIKHSVFIITTYTPHVPKVSRVLRIA